MAKHWLVSAVQYVTSLCLTATGEQFAHFVLALQPTELDTIPVTRLGVSYTRLLSQVITKNK